ncbi:ceramide kinase isoform X2 [Magallana gigas]|uniref:ceramide kinase isoform X2 n=1 Tax=Magallana gigas TaxID=29159 RepID=UPI00333FF50B
MVVKIDFKSISVEEERLKISANDKICDIDICDVIGCHLSEEPAGFLSALFGSSPYLVVRYISKGKNYKWTAETLQVAGSKEECEALQNKINGILGQDNLRPRRLGIFINPVGGGGNSLNVYKNVVHPLFKAANIICDVNVSERPKHMIDLINCFDTASVDGLVILGGDGSLLEVLNCLLTRAQKEADLDYDQATCKLKPLEVPIGIIPTGTGNGTARGLYGNMDVVTAVLHIIRGRTNYNNIQAVYSGGKMVSFSGVVIACGLFTDIMYETDRQRWLKRARYLVIPLYMLLFKRPRLFKVKLSIFSGKSTSKTTDNDDSTEAQDLGEVTSVMSLYGDFFNNATDSKMDFVKLSRESRKTDVFTLLAFKETGRLEFISSFLLFLSYTRSLFQKDVIAPYTVTGYKVKILSGDKNLPQDAHVARMNNLLDVDGEMIDLVDGEYEVWNHIRMVKFYTSH